MTIVIRFWSVWGWLTLLMLASANGVIPAEPAKETLKQPVAEIYHTEGIEAIAISPDGRFLAAGGGDGYHTEKKEKPVAELVVWDIKKRKKVAILTGHTRVVWGVAFSPDGKTLASSSLDKTVRLWNVETGKELAVLKDSLGGIHSVVLSPDGSTLAGAEWPDLDAPQGPDWTTPGTVLLWDIGTWKVRAKLKVSTGFIDRLAFSPDGKVLVGSTSKHDKDKKDGMRGEIWLWNPATGKHIRTLEVNTNRVTSFAFSHDGKTFATGDLAEAVTPVAIRGQWIAKVRLWDTETWKQVKETELEGSVNELAFSPDGSVLVASSGWLYELVGGKLPGQVGYHFFSKAVVLDAKTLKSIVQLPRQESTAVGVRFWSTRGFTTTDGEKIKFWELPQKP